MNPNALQTTNGIAYIGRLNTQPDLLASLTTWAQLADNFVSFNAPRLCSAGKLALRGVQVDACPYNMNMLSDFRRVGTYGEGEGVFTWNPTAASPTTPVDEYSYLSNRGFAPIVVYNPNGINMQYLVTMELRTRFPTTNPAQASHKHHPPASEGSWGAVQNAMTSQGHGAMDIAERVAEYGGGAVAAMGAGLAGLRGFAQAAQGARAVQVAEAMMPLLAV
jgi:hypothetical protein